MFVADGLNEVTAELELTVRLITDQMLLNSVTVHLAAMNAQDFLSPQIYTRFIDGLAMVLSVPQQNVIVFSVLVRLGFTRHLASFTAIQLVLFGYNFT